MSLTTWARSAAFGCGLVLVACGGPSPAPDGGRPVADGSVDVDATGLDPRPDAGRSDAGATDAGGPADAGAVIPPSPVHVLTTEAQLERASRRVLTPGPFADVWADVLARATSDLRGPPAPYVGDDPGEFFRQGRTAAYIARRGALAYRLTRDRRFADTVDAVLGAWAAAWTDAANTPGSSRPQDAGLVIGRVMTVFADAYAIAYPGLSAGTRGRVATWFERMAAAIREGQRFWAEGSLPSHSPPWLGQQEFNNHLGAQMMGLLAIGYALDDRAMVDYALEGADNPRDLLTLIEGVILMPGDAPYRGDPTLTSGAPAVQRGEIYDRYRVIEDKGLHYAHIHLRFVASMAAMAAANGEPRDYFDYTAPGGENLRLPFLFYAPFLLEGRSGAAGGYYQGSPLDLELLSVYELVFERYPDVALREVLELRPRFERELQMFDRSAALLYGPDDVEDRRLRYAFDRVGRTEGWTPRPAASIRAAGGGLEVSVTGPDPGILSPAALGASAAEYGELRLTVVNRTGQTGMQVFFRRTTDAGFGADRVVGATLSVGASPQTVVVDLAAHAQWTGTIDELRINPPGDSAPASVRFDEIALVP